MSKTFIAIFGCLIIFVATTLGATIVFFIKKDFGRKLNSIICGFSAGVMLAASFFGLILPSIENANMGKLSFLPAIIGILLGCIFLSVVELISCRINKSNDPSKNANSTLKRFVLAFTIHNIPEGMAVGVAIGNALALNTSSALISSLMLAIGIAIQNIPEGVAVAMPVYKHTKSKVKGFLWGMLSGIVEPIFALVGLLLASKIEVLLPWSLSFSAGAMLFVTFEDLIPEAKYESTHIGTWSLILGFLLMMILDLVL